MIDNLYQLIQLCTVVVPLTIAGIVWLNKTYYKLDTIVKYVEKLMMEFKPNGGASLKDALNRIESKIAEIDLTQKIYIDADSNIPMFQTDPQGNYRWVNKSFLELVDRPLEEVIGTGWELTVSQQDREAVREEWRQAVSDHRIFEYNYTIQDSFGREHKVKCRASGNEKSGYVGLIYLENNNA